MALREFVEYGAASRNEITLRVNQTLFISKGILSRFGLNTAEAVVLFIDDDINNPCIGIELCKDLDEKRKGCKKISKEKSGFSINVAPVLRFYGINKLKEKVLFDIVQRDGKIILDLKPLLSKQSSDASDLDKKGEM